MQITDAARKIISDAIEAEQCDGVRLYTTRSCCGQSLNFELIKMEANEKSEVINGLYVLMDDDTRQWTGTVTIDADGEKLILINSASCCS